MEDDDVVRDDGIVTNDDLDPRSAEWYRFSVEIDDLLATGRATFAQDTLLGIKASVERDHVVTAGQRRSVRNIEATSLRRPSWRRRFK